MAGVSIEAKDAIIYNRYEKLDERMMLSHLEELNKKADKWIYCEKKAEYSAFK